MYRFNISAPGVVFLNGDPIPKYNQSTIAAGLNMRTKLTFSSFLPNAVKKNFIELNFPDIQLYMKIPLLAYLHLFDIIKSINNDLIICREVRKFLSTLVYIGTYNSDNREHFSSLQAFFSLLVLIAHRHSINITTSFVVKISSELPIGEGLGSSASFLVCLAACFLRWSFLQKGISSYEFESEERLRIMHYCSICERFIFHSSSSISISACIKGTIVIYGKTTEGTYVDWIYQDYPSIKILLVCSNARRKIVQNRKFDIIRHLYSFIQPIMNIIDELSKTFVEMLCDWKMDQDTRKLFQNVDELEPSELKDHYEKLLVNFF
ncbi:mevalonate kinase-like [Pogonomyrmex barbatus]|uniref:mevalonate kinase n=1 Tax=Pogonomyrmex barbatus TaxID=144034 RepID=A0A6I9WJX1_9HYME|nr:mevalonate kinase-like [Pogonomyrmex barbatus]